MKSLQSNRRTKTIQELFKLKEAGIISEAEYEELKARAIREMFNGKTGKNKRGLAIFLIVALLITSAILYFLFFYETPVIKQTYSDGSVYTGQFKNDLFNGEGTLIYANGDKYVGEFKYGLRHGKGTMTWIDGSKYVGGFKDNLFSGQGTYTSKDGKIESGQWESGKFIG